MKLFENGKRNKRALGPKIRRPEFKFCHCFLLGIRYWTVRQAILHVPCSLSSYLRTPSPLSQEGRRVIRRQIEDGFFNGRKLKRFPPDSFSSLSEVEPETPGGAGGAAGELGVCRGGWGCEGSREDSKQLLQKCKNIVRLSSQTSSSINIFCINKECLKIFKVI